jgi:hypothetical protein
VLLSDNEVQAYLDRKHPGWTWDTPKRTLRNSDPEAVISFVKLGSIPLIPGLIDAQIRMAGVTGAVHASAPVREGEA